MTTPKATAEERPSNVCEHSYLRRSCPHCELNEANAEIAQLRASLAAAEAERKEAAGELMIPIPKPGTDTAKLLTANILLRQQRDAAEARAVKAEGERDEVTAQLAAEERGRQSDADDARRQAETHFAHQKKLRAERDAALRKLAELANHTRTLVRQIEAEGGHGYRVHDYAYMAGEAAAAAAKEASDARD